VSVCVLCVCVCVCACVLSMSLMGELRVKILLNIPFKVDKDCKYLLIIRQ
jgi:hypothetical protein